jgi:hypothetical protein
MNRHIARIPGASSLALAMVLLAGCGGAEPLGTGEPEIPVRLTKVGSAEASCQGTWCGYRLTVGTTDPATGARVAARLRLSGDGRYDQLVLSTLPSGEAIIFWEFLSQPGEYQLYICPENGSTSDCLVYTATRFPPS